MKFLGTEDAILYSSAYACISSAISAFAKRGDYVVCDEGANHAIQTGCDLSRSHVSHFKHNDMVDLEDKLRSIANNKHRLTRRWIIFEGLSQNYGDIAPLDQIIALARQYKFRTFIDDSNALGILGKTGRGTHEHFAININEIDVYTASLERAFGSAGGVCAGSQTVVGHQRLGGSGYVFSAASPPFCSVSTLEAFSIFTEQQDQLLSKLSRNSSIVFKRLSSLPQLSISGSPLSPISHLRLAQSSGDRKQDEALLQRICELCFADGVFVSRARYAHNEIFAPAPSIRVTVSAAHSEQQLNEFLDVFANAVERCLA